MRDAFNLAVAAFTLCSALCLWFHEVPPAAPPPEPSAVRCIYGYRYIVSRSGMAIQLLDEHGRALTCPMT